ncbi:MAG: hypothetical protein ABSA83_17075 [Verrucomicrobiota bacterium]|jgi:tetratricopeptide (TPR) repeat protein
MNLDVQRQVNSAAAAVERGDYDLAAKSFRAALDTLLGNQSGLSLSEQAKWVRPIAFDCAQALNKLSRYREALECIALGLEQNPTPFGNAIALAAKGEALCGLKEMAGGLKCFEEAARAHPIVGRLNSAESMLRIGTPELEITATIWVETVASDFDGQLDAERRAEVVALRKQIEARKNKGGSTKDPITVKELIEQADTLARIPGKLPQAADLLEQALKRSPVLGDKYEYRLQLWRKGIYA